MNEKIKVYIKLNNNNEIVEVNSEIFLNNKNGYIFIDEGYGDKFAHAQGNYFSKPLVNENGRYNYLFVNNKIYER